MKKPSDLMTTERLYAVFAFATLTVSTISGVLVYLVLKHSTVQQWTILLHIFSGIAASLLLTPYLLIHFKRTIGFRRTSMLLSGLTTLPLFIIFCYTGWHLLFFGKTEVNQWILQTHIISALIFVGLCLVHLIFHRLLLPEKRKASSTHRFDTIPKKAFYLIVSINIICLVVVLLLTALYDHFTPPYSTDPVVENYQYDYGPHRFRPSMTETANNAFIDRRQIGNSHRCASCHEDITKQWLSSMHQQAASDPTYVTNINLLAEKKGITATRYCEGCHAPVALLTGELSPGGEHGGIKNTLAHNEGVSCMSCHGVHALPNLKGVASYSFKGVEDYLFAQSENPILTRLHNLLIHIKPDQHKKDLANPILSDPKFCSSCHTQFMDKDMNNWGWVKMQDEYGAWLESPYSQQHERSFANANKTRCQDCHMPLEASNDPSANEDAKIRAHHFPGANTFLPLLRGDEKHLQETIKFLQTNKMRVSIEPPNREDALQNLEALDESIRDSQETPYYYYLGEDATMQIVVTNNGVGHNFPGGTIDINEAWLEFLVIDAEGKSVYHSGFIDSESNVDPDAHFYRAIAIDRQGKEVWKHDLFNMVGESFKRVVKAGESDIVRFSFTVPSWVKPPLTATATLKYRKLNNRYARWALKDLYTEIPVVDMAWDSLAIPIRVRREVE